MQKVKVSGKTRQLILIKRQCCVLATIVALKFEATEDNPALLGIFPPLSSLQDYNIIFVENYQSTTLMN